jgi:hypothetical protein
MAVKWNRNRQKSNPKPNYPTKILIADFQQLAIIGKKIIARSTQLRMNLKSIKLIDAINFLRHLA